MKLRYLILPMMLAGVLSAQPRGFRGGASLTPPTASELLTREVDFLTKYFTLTTTQVGQVTAIVSYEQQTCLPPSATLQAARQGLVTAIKSGISANITAALGVLSPLQADQEACRANAAAGIYAILTGPQQAKLGSGLGILLGGGGRMGPPHGH